MPTKVSVVIPSWNGKDLLAACLDSLAAQTLRDFHIIVIDDASTDGTAEMARDRFPWADVLRREKNGGFCEAVNAGIAHSDGEYVFLLNNDVTLHPKCLELLVDAAERTGAGLIAPLILWRDEPHIVYSAGDCQRTNGRPEAIGFRCPADGFPFTEDVFGVSAAAGLYRREVFERIGVFDATFGTYFSDSDVSFRARLAGYRARFVFEAVAWHVGSASLGSSTLKRTFECCVNHALLVARNMPAALILRHAPAILVERAHHARRLFSAARGERGFLYAAGQVGRAALRIASLMPYAIGERRRIQRSRVATAKDIEAMLSP